MADATPVKDETDLTTLVGDNDKFRALVEAKFRTEFDVNVTWGAARLTTRDEFLNEYGSNNPAVRSLLREWIAYYNLQAGFAPPQDAKQLLSEEAMVGLELMAQEYLTKKRTIVLSEATVSTKNELLGMLFLQEEGVSWPNRPVSLLPVDRFMWLNGDKDSDENRTAYMAYLNKTLQLPKDYSLADMQPNRSLLTVDLLRGMPENRKLRGTTDVVIAKTRHIQNGAVRNNVEALIELKKPNNLKSKDHTAETVGEHFAASYLNPKHAVVSVLTDLKNSWTFFWFGKAGCADVALYQLRLENEGGAGLAKYLLDSLSSTTSLRETLPIAFVDRVSFEAIMVRMVENKDNNKRARRDFDDTGDGASSSPDQDLAPSSSGGVDQHPTSGRGTAHQENQGAGGGGNSVMDMASTLSLFAPPANRDVANELDLLDMVDQSEQYEIVRSFAMKHIVPYMTGQY